MKLYFIAAVSQDDADYNLDLFVWAKNAVEAAIFWRNYYEIADSRTQPDKIFTVPLEQPQRAGALIWGKDVVAIGQQPEMAEA